LEKEEQATQAAAEANRPEHEAKTDKERKIVEASLLVFVQGIEVRVLFQVAFFGGSDFEKNCRYIRSHKRRLAVCQGSRRGCCTSTREI
jgi:hypothetical protein